MKYQNKKEALLILEDGTVFRGNSIGYIGTTTGEICFNTGMTGYQEIFTDPSYFGQILVTTTSHIGNYGVKEDEVESDKINISGLVCKIFCGDNYSRYGDVGSLQKYFEDNKLVGISDIDTRKLVRYIRDNGAMNAIISSEDKSIEELKELLLQAPNMAGLELSSKVTTKEPYFFGDEKATYRVAVLDFGVKRSILSCLADRDCHLQVFPSNTNWDTLKQWKPDGIMLSNGPGDPSVMSLAIANVQEFTQLDLPIFGICLGHQILALSQGLITIKMHNGHRGVNHPVLNLETKKGEITSQNHGFVVDKDSVVANSTIAITHTHLNDGTLAGFKIKDKKIFSVQFHPEASAGPHDSRYLFDEFIENIKQSIKENKMQIS